MNSLPPSQRGFGAGMLATSMNSAAVLSIGIFFTLMVVGLSSRPPAGDPRRPRRARRRRRRRRRRSPNLPPVTTLFAAFLGYNPMETLLGADTLAALPPAQSEELTGRSSSRT